tara:strand:- start:1096 stop:1791 length:696 start_codon:yes stop_codon:yes gene_type:complete
MIKKKNLLIAIIPARKGSKGIVKKNMKILSGKPLIYYTIKAALSSKYIDKTIISSDDEKVIKYVKKFNVDLIRRPKNISRDVSTASEVVFHVIKRLSNYEKNLNPFIIYLQPTSPLRTSDHIDKMISNFEKDKRTCAISIKEIDSSLNKSFRIDDKKNLKTVFNKKYSNSNRQDLPKLYLANGAIYLFRMSHFLKLKGFPTSGNYPYIMKEKDSIDIDSINDFKLASKYLK